MPSPIRQTDRAPSLEDHHLRRRAALRPADRALRARRPGQ